MLPRPNIHSSCMSNSPSGAPLQSALHSAVLQDALVGDINLAKISYQRPVEALIIKTLPAGVFQHELGAIVPPMSRRTYEALKADIKEHGVRDPIVWFEGRVLDGIHRLSAATELGCEAPRVEFSGAPEQALAFVLSKNLLRRDLTKAQKAVVLAMTGVVPPPAEDEGRSIRRNVAGKRTLVDELSERYPLVDGQITVRMRHAYQRMPEVASQRY